MFKYFYGPDTYAARHAVNELAEREKAQIQWVDQAHLQDHSLADKVGQQRGLFGKKLVVVRDPASWPKALQEDAATYITEEKTGGLWILWDRGLPDKRSKLWRAVKAVAQEFPTPTSPQLTAWLVGLAEEWGGALEQPAAVSLIARVGTDRWRLMNELQRLLLVGKHVTTALVERELAMTETAEIFAMLEALARGERAQAISSVQTLLAAGHSEFYIISMLAYQFRTLLIVRAGLDGGQGATAIAAAGKLHPFVVEKSIPVARRLPYGQWRDGLTRILATDFAIKQGRVDARTGLLMLVLTLSQLVPTTKSARVTR